MTGAPDTYPFKGYLCIRFGKGAVGVFTGTRNGEPAVLLREASPPGEVGQPVSLADAEDHPLRVALIFPTAEQAEAVADALVGQPSTPSAPAAADEAMDEYVKAEKLRSNLRAIRTAARASQQRGSNDG